jgi:hypothetical protein
MAAGGRGRELDALAARQLGLVSVDQLRRLGFTESQVRTAAAHGRLVPARRGVFRLAGTRPTWEAAVLAAVLAAPPGSVASHGSAGRLWRLFDGERVPPGPAIELTVPSEARLRGVTSRRRPVPAGERALRFSVPVTSIGRTLLDLGVLGPEALGLLTDEALRRGLIRLDQLRRLAELPRTADGRRGAGIAALEEVLADRLPGYDAGASAWERQMDSMWERWGLPPAERQYEITTPGGVYRVDRAIVAERIAVEWDGYEYHGRRSRFDRDSDRRADLAAVGWWSLGFTSHSSPARVRSAIWSAVSQRRQEAG